MRKRGLNPHKYIAERIEIDDNGCWLWTGAVSSGGYGRAVFQQEATGAHRFSWIAHEGMIPEGMCVCHTCDVRKCVNPEHLWLGTTAENQRDCTAKKRRAHGPRNGRSTSPETSPRGERHGRARLNPSMVREIRSLRGKVSQSALGRRFGVPQTAISAVQLGKTWQHVE